MDGTLSFCYIVAHHSVFVAEDELSMVKGRDFCFPVAGELGFVRLWNELISEERECIVMQLYNEEGLVNRATAFSDVK